MTVFSSPHGNCLRSGGFCPVLTGIKRSIRDAACSNAPMGQRVALGASGLDPYHREGPHGRNVWSRGQGRVSPHCQVS